MINRTIALAIISLLVSTVSGGNLKWSCSDENVITITPAPSTGLDDIFVVRSTSGVSVSYPSASPQNVKWYRYSNLGGGYAEEITDVVTASGFSTISLSSTDMGYIIESPEGRYCFWTVDYSNHVFTANSLTVSAESDCSETILDFDGNGSEIVYFTINGRRVVLDREIKLSYLTLEPDDAGGTFREKNEIVTFASVSNRIMASAPLRSTTFTLEGDRFLSHWGAEVVVESPVMEPHAVSALCSATQTSSDADNEVNNSSASLGGSAPCMVDFAAEVTDAVIFKEWQISRFSDFDVIDIRVSDLSFTHTFNEEGSTYVRFICANADGNCEYISETFTISIGASSLRCPNAFSSHNGDGVNDEWKVSYSSIISFECHIFDRFGRKMASFTDPALGWDGHYKGKLVPAGVYYYVIKAKGADGKKYDLAGDINIVKFE